MSLRTGRTGCALLLAAVLTSGCPGLIPPIALPGKPEPKPTRKAQEPSPPEDPLSDEALSGLSFKDTELYHLFAPYPYNSLRPFEEQFPRVALTVLDAPELQSWPIQNSYVVKACWRLRAKIWFPPAEDTPSRDNPTREPEFKDVEPFYWCFPRDIQTEIHSGTLEPWLTRGPTKHTGNQRTEGYLPPEVPVPYNLRHQKFWGKGAFDPTSMNGLMLSSVLYYMGFDWSQSDPRVWLVEFIQAR